MKKVVLAVAVMFFVGMVSNAGAYQLRNMTADQELVFETYREIMIQKAANAESPLPLDVADQVKEVKNRISRSRLFKKGEPVMREDDDVAVVMLTEISAAIVISQYESTMYLDVYYDGDFLKRIKASDKFILYSIEKRDGRLGNENIEKKIKWLEKEISDIIKWENFPSAMERVKAAVIEKFK